MERYESLDAMSAAADAVVVGWISSVRPGRVFGSATEGSPEPGAGTLQYVTAVVKIQESFGKALPGSPSRVPVEFLAPPGFVAQNLDDIRPDEPTLFFLRNKGVDARTQGLPLSVQKKEAPFYRLVNSQGMFRGVHGAVRSFAPKQQFVLDLEARPFVGLLEHVRAAIGTAEAPSPSSAPSLEARSDAFWSRLAIEGAEAEHYDSLEAMVAAADAVVVGRITSVKPGRVFGSVEEGNPDPEAGFVHSMTAIVSIDESLGKALPGSPSTLLVEFLAPRGSVAEELDDVLPIERALFVLRNEGVDARMQGLSTNIQQQNAPYYRLINSHGLFRDIDGAVRGRYAAEEPFVLDLEGRTFETLLLQVRAAAD